MQPNASRKALVSSCLMAITFSTIFSPMKLFYYFLLAGLVSLTSCEKEDTTPLLTASFEQAITLRYQQSAALSDQSSPELTVTVEDVNDRRCPSNAFCFVPGIVYTNLGIQDQSGAIQPLTLRLDGTVDSAATVQANGRQYSVVLRDVTPYPVGGDVPKKDKRVVLTVRRQ